MATKNIYFAVQSPGFEGETRPFYVLSQANGFSWEEKRQIGYHYITSAEEMCEAINEVSYDMNEGDEVYTKFGNFTIDQDRKCVTFAW